MGADQPRGALHEAPSTGRARSRILRTAISALSLAACLALALLNRHLLGDAAQRAARASWLPLLPVPALFLVWNHAASVAWRTLILTFARGRAPSVWRLMVMRIQAGAINLLVPLFGLGGDLTRTLMLARARNRVAASAPSVLLDSMTSALAGLAFSVLGMSAQVSALPGGGASIVVLATLTCGFGALMWTAPQLVRFVQASGWIGSSGPMAPALEALAGGHGSLRASMGTSLAWHLVERGLMALEVWLLAFALDIPLDASQLLFSTAVMTAFTIVLFFVPGQLGAPEGGLSLAFMALGLPGEAGLSIALLRRARQLVFSCIALAWLAGTHGRGLVPGRTAEP